MTTKSIKRSVLWLGLLLALALVFGSFCGEPLVNRFTFFPEKGMQVRLEDFSVPIEKVSIQTKDRVRLSGFYLPMPGFERTFLFFHGNAGNASHRLRHGEVLSQLGANVLLLDYRGYGLSQGEPSEEGIYLDGEAGLQYLLEERGVPLHKVVVFGRSLGTAVAVHIAQNRGVGGIVLVCPFTSGRDMAKGSGLSLFTVGMGNPFDTRAKMKFIKSPLLILHAEDDELVPMEMGKELFALAPVKKEFVVMKGASHNNAIDSNPWFFVSQVQLFVSNFVVP